MSCLVIARRIEQNSAIDLSACTRYVFHLLFHVLFEQIGDYFHSVFGMCMYANLLSSD